LQGIGWLNYTSIWFAERCSVTYKIIPTELNATMNLTLINPWRSYSTIRVWNERSEGAMSRLWAGLHESSQCHLHQRQTFSFGILYSTMDFSSTFTAMLQF